MGTLRTHATAIGFVIRLLPMLPSKPINLFRPRPITETVQYRTLEGEVESVIQRPRDGGPHPAIVMCLGVVPFGVEHPQVPRLLEALARAGFIALIHWSGAMRDRRLVPEDAENIAMAYDWLLRRPDVDPARSGLFGTCVGGSFALLAAARPLIRTRIAFVGAFAPFSSMPSLVRDIASGTRSNDGTPEPWPVDPLTRDVFVRSVTDVLDPFEAERLRRAYATGLDGFEGTDLSPDAQKVQALLAAADRRTADDAMSRLPHAMLERLHRMSPVEYVDHIAAPVIVIGHDRDDLVIPVGESRRLATALSSHPGAQYTEYAMFEHADPTKRKLSPLRLVVELRRFYLSLYPMFRQAVG